MTKTLEQIKDDYADERGFLCWEIMFEKYVLHDHGNLERAIDEVANRYALEVAKETQRRCAENSELMEVMPNSAV